MSGSACAADSSEFWGCARLVAFAGSLLACRMILSCYGKALGRLIVFYVVDKALVGSTIRILQREEAVWEPATIILRVLESLVGSSS